MLATPHRKKLITLRYIARSPGIRLIFRYDLISVLIASKETGLEVNAEKTKYMVMSRDQNAGQNGYIQIGNKSFETVEQFKYLETTLMNQNSMHEEIKSRLKSGNTCYHSMQNILSSSSLSKNVKIKIYRTIIFPVVLCGCETWSLTSREECRLRVFENSFLRRIFGPKFLTKYHSGYHVKKTEMGRTCGMYGGGGEVQTRL